MKRAVAVVGAVAMLMVAASAFAQGSFAGKWTIDAEKTAAAMPAGAPAGGGGGGRGGGAPGPMTITQTATTLTIETEGQNGPTKREYTLDGSEHTMTMGQTEAKYTAKVAGSTITIATTQDRGNGPTTTTAVYSMDAGNLVIATTRPGRNGGEPTTGKVFYKKAM